MRACAQKESQPRQPSPPRFARPDIATVGPIRLKHPILHSQRAIGRQAVQRTLQTNAEEVGARLTGTPPPRFGHDFSRISVYPPATGAIQARLAINQPGDEYEQEADRVSAQLMRVSEPQLQRACACGRGCPRCQTPQPSRQHEHLQTEHPHTNNASAVESTPAVNEVVHEPQRQASDSAIGPRLGLLIESSRPSGRLPADARPALSGIPGHTLEKILIHDDSAAHEAARGLGAHAFTVGTSIYFTRGAYQPATSTGLRVLAHEAAHAHQQVNASLPPADQLVVASPSSGAEADAEKFAAALGSGASVAPPAQMPTGGVARAMRVTFEATHQAPAPIDLAARIDPAIKYNEFSFGGGDPALFSWQAEVKVRGTPEEGSEWKAGMLQLVRNYRLEVWWGREGSAQTSCHGTYENTLDSKDAGPWFDSSLIADQPRFANDGDTQTASIKDSPQVTLPYTNFKKGPPDATSGRFDFSASFITYVSAFNSKAENTLDVFSKDAYQHLKSVKWQLGMTGEFDGSRTGDERVRKTGGGKTTVGSVRTYGPLESPTEHPPKVTGITGFQKLCPIQQCWDPNLPCPHLQEL